MIHLTVYGQTDVGLVRESNEDAFVMADLGSSPGVVYVEDITDGRVFEDPGTVSRVTLSYKSLQSEALPKGASRELIMRVAEERWKGTTS